MNPEQYKQEVDKLARETSELIGTSSTSPESTGKFAKVLKYKTYIFIVLGTLLALYIIKPKYILKIKMGKDADTPPDMVLDIGKFVTCWILLSIVISFVHVIVTKMRKPK